MKNFLTILLSPFILVACGLVIGLVLLLAHWWEFCEGMMNEEG